MLLGEDFLERNIGLVDVGQIALETVDNSNGIFSGISSAIAEPNHIGVSVVSKVFLELTEDGLMCLLSAQFDLLGVSEVVGDVLLWIAISVYLFEIGLLHFLKSWRDTVGVIGQLLYGLLFHGLAVSEMRIEDGRLVLGLTHH